MSSRVSAGLLPYRRSSRGSLEVLLAHYGGPLWARKDVGAWTVVKGEVDPRFDVSPRFNGGFHARDRLQTSASRKRERSARARSKAWYTESELLAAAKREFSEETGINLSGVSEFISLGEITQRGGKIVHAWAFEDQSHGNLIVSLSKDISLFEMEWPPHSGRIQQFPEIDRVEWFSLDIAREKVNPAQVVFLDRLSSVVQGSSSSTCVF